MSLSKGLARMTRSWRIALGLAAEPTSTSARLSRSNARRALPGGRLNALEKDIDLLLGAWNQHIPQILARFAKAQREQAGTRATEERCERLEATVARLTDQVNALSLQLADLDTPSPTKKKNRTRPG